MNFSESYTQINRILALLLGLVFFYILWASMNPNKTIPCYYKTYWHKQCPTCGMTRAFTKIINGEFLEAKALNKSSILFFSFFLIEFILRSLIPLLFSRIGSLSWRKYWIYLDITSSLLFFGLVFYPMVLFILQ